jgi:MoaA/NifB/PqqE/SkfB family radical SAM enzyme
VLAFARSRGLRTSFITTGYGPGPVVLERFRDSCADQIEVAIDSADPARHCKIKGGLDCLADATGLVRGLTSDGRRLVVVNTVILKENMEQLPEITGLVASLGAHEHRLFSCLRFRTSVGLQEQLTVADADRIWNELVPEAERRARASSLELVVHGRLEFDADDREDRAAAVQSFIQGRPNRSPRKGLRCGAPDTQLSIVLDGTVIPCLNPSLYCEIARRPGSAFELPVWSTLRSPEFAELCDGAGRLPACECCMGYSPPDPPAGPADRGPPDRDWPGRRRIDAP